MEPLRAVLLHSGGGGGPVSKPWCKLAGPIVLPLSIYRTSERGDGMLDMFRDAPRDTRARVEQREAVKLQFLLFEMARRLAAPPPPRPPAEKGEGEDGGEATDDEAAADPAAPLEGVFVIPVYKDADELDEMLMANAANPDVVDYSGVHAMAWYLSFRGEAHDAVVEVLSAILARNKLAYGTGPPPKRQAAPSKLVEQNRIIYRSNVDAMNGPNPSHTIEKCMFRLERGGEHGMTSDWSLTFRDADDLAFMLETVCDGWRRPPAGVRIEDIAEVFTRPVAAANNGSSTLPAFYRLPPTAQLALRSNNANVTFGGSVTKAALWLPVSELPNMHTYGRVVSFPMLRMPAADPDLAAAECSRCAWLINDQTVRRGMNAEGMFERLKLHTTRTLEGRCWDLSLLAQAGTEVARQNFADGQRAVLAPPTLVPGDPDGEDGEEDGDGHGWWRPYRGNDRAGWELRAPYDTAKGPDSFRPSKENPLRLRLTAVLGLVCGFDIAGAYLRVEAYTRVEAHTMTLVDGEVIMDASALRDSAAWADTAARTAHRKRPAPVLFADMSGPRWPAACDWEKCPHGSRTAATWKPNRRLHWVSDSGKARVIVAVKVWAHTDADDATPTEQWDRPLVEAEQATATPAAAPRRGPRVDILCREVYPPQWVSVAARAGVVSIPTAYAQRNRLVQRLLIDAEEGFRSRTLLPTSFNDAFAYFDGVVDRMAASGDVAEGHEFVFGNLNGHMNFYANFLLMLEYVMDVRMYHPQVAKIYLAFKHICRTRDELTKPLHTMMYGPPAVGKSKAIDFCSLMTPPGIKFVAVHKSGQRNMVKLDNADQLSCQACVTQ